MYQRIITYNFSNDEVRDSFVELIETLGFKQQPDQSTYAQPSRRPRDLSELKTKISDWSFGEKLTSEDSVQIYVLGDNTINRVDMKYNTISKKLR